MMHFNFGAAINIPYFQQAVSDWKTKYMKSASNVSIKIIVALQPLWH